MAKQVSAVLVSSHDPIKMTTKLQNHQPGTPLEDQLNAAPITEGIKKRPRRDQKFFKKLTFVEQLYCAKPARKFFITAEHNKWNILLVRGYSHSHLVKCSICACPKHMVCTVQRWCWWGLEARSGGSLP